jgi:small subunit ribosomal protein S20
MPIIKSAIKRMRQNETRRKRLQHYKSNMKSMMKLMLGYISTQDTAKAKKILPDVIHSIDNAAKKNIIHKNNAARKKSRIQRTFNALTAT